MVKIVVGMQDLEREVRKQVNDKFSYHKTRINRIVKEAIDIGLEELEGPMQTLRDLNSQLHTTKMRIIELIEISNNLDSKIAKLDKKIKELEK